MKTPNAQTQANTFMVEKFEPMKITNVDVVLADKPGRNRNVYSKAVLKEAITYYKKVVELDPTYKYAFAKHPKDSDEEWIGLIAAAIDDLYFDNASNMVKADFTLLPTIWGHFIAWLLENDYHIGISLRGKADAEQSSMEIGGKYVSIKQRHNLRLEGIDFVVYPSYIVTHATKENITEQTQHNIDESDYVGPILPSLCLDCSLESSNVMESFLSDTEKTYDISVTDLKNMLTTTNDNNTRRNSNMPTDISMDAREAQIQVDRLTVDRDKLQQELNALTEQVQQYITDAEAKKELVTELDGKISKRQNIVTGLNDLEDRMASKQDKLTSVEEQIASVSTNLEALTQDYNNMLERSESETVVRAAGQTFSSQKPPRVRLVDVQEKITSADWPNVNKGNITNLVALTQDKGLADAVFGLGGTKYPVYQAFASDAEDYDVDLVLNRNALKSTLSTLQGKRGMSFDAKEKAGMTNYLHGKYAELETAGVTEIPSNLKAMKDRTQILESLKFNESDAFVESVVETAIMKGLVELDVEDYVTESTKSTESIDKVQEGTDEDADKVQENTTTASASGAFPSVHIDKSIAYDNISSAVMNTLLGINRGTIVEQAMDDAAVPTGDADMEGFVNTLVTAPDGSPTDFSEAFGVESVDDFQTKYLATLTDLVSQNDFASALGMVQMAVATYSQAMVDVSDDATNVGEHINTAFKVLASAITPVSPEEEEVPTPEGEDVMQQDQEQPMTPVQESTDNNTNKNTDGGQEDMLFDDLKTQFEKKFENVDIKSEDDVKAVIDKLITDYEQSYAELKTLELEVFKKEKTNELAQAGVAETVIESELEGITDLEELETITSKLIAVANSVSESATATADDVVTTEERKSHGVVEDTKTDKVDEMDAFSRALKMV